MWSNPQFPVDFVTFTEEILNGKLIFCAVFDNNMDFLYEEGAPGPTSIKSEETFDKLHKLVQFKVWQEE